MKAIILAGGLGTRLSEETSLKPKPMVEIGDFPILWHIMKIYSHHGINDFVICCGYKGYVIKEFFSNYLLHLSDVTVDLTTNETVVHRHSAEPWRISLVDTGADTMTGGRLRRVRSFLDDSEDFCFTYGDGVADVDIGKTIEFHKSHGKLGTVLAVRPPGRFGTLSLDKDSVIAFKEKPESESDWINGGFFVLSPKVIDLIEGDTTFWEREPLEKLAADRQLKTFFHHGFWQPMDTLRDKNYLQALWDSGKAPWKKW